MGGLTLLIMPVLAFWHLPMMTNIAWIAAALIGLGVIWAKGVRPIMRFIRATVRAADALEEAIPTLREIAEEFKPNDGRSLVDVIHRMDSNIHTNARNNALMYQAVVSLDDVDSDVLPFEPLEDTPAPENR